MPPSVGKDLASTNFAADQKEQLPIVATKEGCHGGTFIITGSNTGLGYEAAKHLVQLSAAKVILAVRSPVKGDEAKTKIEADTGIKGVVEVWPLDMGSYASIRAFAESVHKLDRLDAILENAGVALTHWSTADGNEQTIMVNVLGTMLLAFLVMPKLKQTAKEFGIQPHLSFVGSGVAFTTPGVLEGIEGDIIDYLNEESHAIMSQRYPLSKLVELYAVREYALLNPVSTTGVVINYVNPGLCTTELLRNANEQTRKIVGDMRVALGRTSEVGSRNLLYGAVGGTETHGKYLSECVAKEHYITPWMLDESGQKIQKAVWESVSAHLNKVVPEVL